jgi:hypothetical protein
MKAKAVPQDTHYINALTAVSYGLSAACTFAPNLKAKYDIEVIAQLVDELLSRSADDSPTRRLRTAHPSGGETAIAAPF